MLPPLPVRASIRAAPTPSRSRQVNGPTVKTGSERTIGVLNPRTRCAKEVVVVEPLRHPLEMAPIDYQDPVQVLTLNGTDLPLDVGIRLGGCDRLPDHLDAFGLEHQIRAAAVLGVVIVDQKPGVDSDLGKLPAQVPRPLTNPVRGRPLQSSLRFAI